MPMTSVIIVTYQSELFIGRTLDAVLELTTDAEVIVVDNASTDATTAIVGQKNVRLVSLERNCGFTGGCHAGVAASSGDTLIFVGHDVTPTKGWLAPLVSAAHTGGVGAAMATVEDGAHPGTYNTSGGHLTYFGLAWVSDLGQPIPAGPGPDLVDVPFPSGTAMAMTRTMWDRFGGFRQSLFMYHEDTDLGWRIRISGLRVVRCRASRVVHHYDFARSAGKMFWLERNRRVLLATNYRLPTRILLSPALFAADIGIWIVAARDGWLKEKSAAYTAAIQARHTNAEERKAIKAIRSVGDAEILRTMEWSVSGMQQVAAPKGSVVVDAIFGAYLRAIIPIVGLFDRMGTRGR
jgi:GT2 family glycosyltransferase